MDARIEFRDGTCKLTISAEDDWERKLLGVIASGVCIVAVVNASSSSNYYSRGKTDYVSVTLTRCKIEENQSMPVDPLMD